MLTVESLKQELEERLDDIGKHHLSVRWEPGPGIVRVGVCPRDYTWETREVIIDRLLAFETAHADELAVEFDIFAMEDVNTAGFAEV